VPWQALAGTGLLLMCQARHAYAPRPWLARHPALCRVLLLCCSAVGNSSIFICHKGMHARCTCMVPMLMCSLLLAAAALMPGQPLKVKYRFDVTGHCFVASLAHHSLASWPALVLARRGSSCRWC
jgi:hypothetical protein